MLGDAEYLFEQVDDAARHARALVLLGVHHDAAAGDVPGSAVPEREVRGGPGDQREGVAGVGQQVAQVPRLPLLVLGTQSPTSGYKSGE